MLKTDVTDLTEDQMGNLLGLINGTESGTGGGGAGGGKPSK